MGTRGLIRAGVGPAQPRRVASATPPTDPGEQIEVVATELFIRNGYHGVSYLGIGKALGLTSCEETP